MRMVVNGCWMCVDLTLAHEELFVFVLLVLTVSVLVQLRSRRLRLYRRQNPDSFRPLSPNVTL